MATVRLQRPPQVLKLLAEDIRWQIVQLLTISDYRAQELIQRLKKPANLVSYHLKQLRLAKLITLRRSSADARDIYYSLDLAKLRTLYLAGAGALHPALSNPVPQTDADFVPARRFRVLFLCTHNSARSQMAEALTRTLSKGRVDVYSAGTEPSRVHPDAIRTMADMNIDMSGHHSKSMNEFLGQKFDYVITVCDNAREACPLFPGDPVRIHWSFPDPAALENPSARQHAFQQTAVGLSNRIYNLLALIENESKSRAG